jgi:peptidyl-prolyl cis-trans isomerase D
LTVVAIPAVDAQGVGPDGRPIAALTGGNGELLRTANQTPEGEASDFIPVGDADVVVAVDHITPSSIRPFDEVREQLSRNWIARERARRLQELVNQVKQAVQGGQGFAAAARAHHMTVVATSRPLTREQGAQFPARRLGAAMFSANEGDVVSEVSPDGGAVIAAVVEHINRIDPAQAGQQVEQVRAQAQRPMAQEMGEAIQGEVVSLAHPRKNTRLINQLFRGSRAAGGDDQQQ